MSGENTQLTRTDFTEDKVQNTRMLLEVPGLAEQSALQIGSAIFFPKNLGCENDYRVTPIDIDGKSVQFIYAVGSDTGTMYTTPAEAFNYKGITHIFRHHGIPLEFKYCVLRLAAVRNDLEALSLAFNEEEKSILIEEITQLKALHGPDALNAVLIPVDQV
jgi:hypothetical protein